MVDSISNHLIYREQGHNRIGYGLGKDLVEKKKKDKIEEVELSKKFRVQGLKLKNENIEKRRQRKDGEKVCLRDWMREWYYV